MDGKTYTVQHPDGRTVTFQWNDPNPPTDADLEEVFKSVPTVQKSQPQTKPQPQQLFTRANVYDPIAGVFKGVGQKFQQASDYFRQGDIGAGIGAGGQAGLNALFSPLSAGVEAVRQIPIIGSPIATAVSTPVDLLNRALTYSASGYLGGAKKLGVPLSTNAVNELSGMVGTAGTAALIPEVAKMVPALGRGMETEASKMAGKAFGAGENFMQTRQLGRFAQERGITLTQSGYDKAKTMAQNLNDDIANNVINPAVASGKTIDASQYIQSLQDYKTKLQNRAVPDKASILAVDRMISSAQDRANASSTPGQIAPDVAQQMKVENNAILADIYDKMARSGNMEERIAAKKAALVQLTDNLRSQLEDLHPELKTVNRQEGSAIQLRNAIYDYLNRTARGEGSPAMVARGGISKAATVSVYDLLHVKPIMSRIAIVLGKAGRTLSGNEVSPLGIQNPAPPDATGTPGNILPPTGGTPTSPSLSKQANQLGIKFDGIQKGIGPQFTDTAPNGTGSTFYLSPGQSLGDVLARHRRKFFSGNK